jgi:hypothetical protein
VTGEAQLERDTYFCVHLLQTPENRQAPNALEHVMALWLDLDDGDYPSDGPQPTARVRSSTGKWHLYFRLTGPIPVTDAVDLNARLCAFASGDESKQCLSSVLRPTGTANFKYDKPELVVGWTTGVPPWEPDVLEQALPALEQEVRDRRQPYDGPALDLGPYLQAVEVLGEVPDSHGLKYRVVCPWVHEHSHGDRSGTRLGQRSSGALWFHCDHEHCQGRGWRQFRREVRSRSPKRRQIRRPGYTGTPLEVRIYRG